MEAICPVSLKFCVDPDFLGSANAHELMKDDTSYKKLTDSVLRGYLETEPEGSEESWSLETLDEIKESKLRMKMWNKNAR